MHFLISAGPTREYLDPVRYLSNGSSGRMGYACAAAAVRRGHRVTLVSGPVDLHRPAGVRLVQVVSTAQMAEAMERHFERCDCAIMTAAVCDYRPTKRQRHKIQKQGLTLTVVLERTEDILAELGRRKEKQILIGFALQDRAGRQNAIRKLKEKNLDAIVLNTPAAIGAERSDVAILRRGGRWESYRTLSKKTLADKLVRLAEQIGPD